ncbi:MAG: hypothetical protein E3J94_01265 [Desulfobacteraceae bacterium]|nr:MAG: hypothetical protein E3J94_01265 [Desulfobacteraceae bacterium]
MKGLNPYELEILLVLAGEIMYWRKTGVYPSQQRILKELEKKFGIIRCIRTLNRWLAVTVSHDLLWRQKRHIRDSILGWIFRSSLYKITGPGWRLVIKNSKYTWDQFSSLIKEATANFRKPKKNRKVFRPSGELTSIGDILGAAQYPDTS